ncbi:substrate-binding periplasmic protein [Pseudodesulfovibrio portus]|uniref:Solute-binding protein family 3/N-terminal domain-containing protein n=1 Tax=Pseudodesulfovibrio portus TaxID=231439 RepID=A0ABM8ATP5_9BACT|nr:transporter substrate-binding domain-containing protein [Pseudodesulfovibrio portus]BDQ34872.1 hypothetical protein JCM14722_24140 [Pseudodesulfovibrio portus]
MSKINMGFLFGLLLLITLPVVPARAGDSVLLTSGEWPPFFSESLPGGGMGNRVVAESFKLVGLSVEFLYQPWIRAMQTARYGPAIGSSGWLRTPEREQFFLFSDPIFTSRRVFFHRRDHAFDWQTLADIKDMRVAVTLGSADEFPFDDILSSGGGKVDIAQSYASGMRKLAAGRVDIYACNLDVGLHVLKHQLRTGEAALITYHPRSIFEETNHLIISRRLRDAEAVMARFNAGLRRLKESGRYGVVLGGEGN